MMIEMVSVIKYFAIFSIWLFKLFKSAIPYHSLLILVIRAKIGAALGHNVRSIKYRHLGYGWAARP